MRIAIHTVCQPIRAPEMCHWWGGTRNCVIDEMRSAIHTACQRMRAPEMCHWWGSTRCESRFAPLASQPEHRRCVRNVSLRGCHEVRIAIRTPGQAVRAPKICHCPPPEATFEGCLEQKHYCHRLWGVRGRGRGGKFPKIGVGGRIQEGDTTLTHAFKTPKGVGGYIYIYIY